MRSGQALRLTLIVLLALVCACTEKHTFSDGHVIEIARNENYWFRWIMLGVCGLGAVALIGLAIAGHGVRVGIYALPLAIGAALLYPGTTTPRQRSLDRIAAYQAKLGARGDAGLAKEAAALAASLQRRRDTEIAAFERALGPKLERATAALRAELEGFAKAGALTIQDLERRAANGDAGAKRALAALDRAARLRRAAHQAERLRKNLERARAQLQDATTPAATLRIRIAAGRALVDASLPALDTDPGVHRRQLFESIVRPLPAERPE